MKEKEAKVIFESYDRLKTIQHTQSGIDIELAKELSYLKTEERYKIIMGYDEASWKAFCAQPELGISYPKAQRLVKIYETYIVKLGLPPLEILGIDSNNLQRLATIVTKENVSEWLAKAKELSRSDLTREIKYGHIDETKCTHQFISKRILTCKLCGLKMIERKPKEDKTQNKS